MAKNQMTTSQMEADSAMQRIEEMLKRGPNRPVLEPIDGDTVTSFIDKLQPHDREGVFETEQMAAVRAIVQDRSLSSAERIAKAEALSFQLSKDLMRSIYKEDLDQKLLELGSEENEARFLAEAQNAANIWWEGRPGDPNAIPPIPPILGARDNPVAVINHTNSSVAVQQFSVDPEANHSAELFQQLYYDAAKAQKRLVQIADGITAEGAVLPDEISAIEVSMPTIKGTVRATYKTWMPDHQRLLALREQEAEEGLSETEAAEKRVLQTTVFGEGVTEDFQPFAAGLRDLSRGTVEVPKLTEVQPAVIHFIQQTKLRCPGAEVTRFKNKFKAMYDGTDNSGYADIQVHIRIDGGHICEMQFNCRSMMDFKSFGGKRRCAKTEREKCEEKGIEYVENPAGNWAVLLGERSQILIDTANTLERLDPKTMINSEPPDKALDALLTFKNGLDSGQWPLNAHVIYDITRWLENAPAHEGHDELRLTVIRELKALSLAGSDAFKDIIAKSEGGEDQDFLQLLEPLANFTLDLG